jgi:hypothetical protein
MLQMPELKLVVERAASPKCPRCWQHNGIPENHRGLCDRCCNMLIEGMDDWVRRGYISAEDGQAMIKEIWAHRKLQLEKYKKELGS